VALVNRLSGKGLDETGYSVSNGTPIQQWSYAGASNQQWQLTPITFYNLVSRSSGLALDIAGDRLSSEALAEQSQRNASARQQWQLVSTEDGYYALSNNLSGKVLDVRDDSGANGALIQHTSIYPQRTSSGSCCPSTAGITSSGVEEAGRCWT